MLQLFVNMILPQNLSASCNFTGRVSACKSLSGRGVPVSEMPIFKHEMCDIYFVAYNTLVYIYIYVNEAIPVFTERNGGTASVLDTLSAFKPF